MSSNVEREWFYYLKGRNIHLYQLLSGSRSERITQSGVIRSHQKELMYPNEDIADGLRLEYTSLDEPFVSEPLETTTVTHSSLIISFSASTYIRSTTENAFSSFAVNDKIRVQGSGSNDGDYTISAVGSWNPGAGAIANGQITTSESTIVAEDAGERVVITQIPAEDATPDESSHINLNKLLSLAVVDYVKAMLSDSAGQVDLKEYYMKEFYGKLGDNESNKRKISMSFPSGVYAVR
tara:strand:+ start:506 stop:1216 length:711 start_codon:yes stop_codon:yes gene_type:complete